MPTNNPTDNVKQRHGPPHQDEPYDPISEAEELRVQLQAALSRTNRLVASLKQHRRQSRAVKTALASLRRLQP
jgi:hypothetical protein